MRDAVTDWLLDSDPALAWQRKSGEQLQTFGLPQVARIARRDEKSLPGGPRPWPISSVHDLRNEFIKCFHLLLLSLRLAAESAPSTNPSPGSGPQTRGHGLPDDLAPVLEEL